MGRKRKGIAEDENNANLANINNRCISQLRGLCQLRVLCQYAPIHKESNSSSGLPINIKSSGFL